jgi:hypothetical protein
MNGNAGEVLVEEEVIKLISCALTINEDDCTSGRSRQEQILHSTALHSRLNVDDLLFDVQMRTTSSANSNANMDMSEMLLGQITSHLWESGGKQ